MRKRPPIPRDSAATVAALCLIDHHGITPYRAAKEAGIALSTIYRALRRRREREAATQDDPRPPIT